MTGKFDSIINTLWTGNTDRRIARAFVDRFAGMPGMDDRIAPMLHEAAATADKIAAGQMTIEDGRGYLASFAVEGLGVAPHVMHDLGAWFDGPGAEVAVEQPPATEAEKPAAEKPPAPSADAKPQPAPPAQTPPAAPPAQPAGPTRDQVRAEIYRWEQAMRAPAGSDEWKSYWRGPGQQAYHAALEALQTAPETAPVAPLPAPAAAEPSEEPAS